MHNFRLQPKHFGLLAFTSLMLLLMVVAFIGSQNSKELRSKAAHPPEPRETQVPTRPPPPPPVTNPPPPPVTKTPTLTPSSCVGTIQGYIWNEKVTDAVKDKDEIVETNVPLQLLKDGQTVITSVSSTVDDGTKNYFIPNVACGNYWLKINKAGYKSVGCSDVIPPSVIPQGGNIYFYCADTYTSVVPKRWTPNSSNPFESVLNNLFPVSVNMPLVKVDFPLESLAPVCEFKKYGDANCDGNVDGIDYSIWLNSQCRPGPGQACADLKADFDNDGDVDDDDYQLWFDGRNTIDQLKKK